MSKTIQQTLHEAKQAVLNYELGKAIATMAAVYAQRPSLFGHDSFKTIHKDYSLMVDFMMRGYKDNQRSELYKLLLHKLYALVSNLEISWRCKNVTVYVAAFQRAARLNLSPTFLREVLERFVTDVTLLSAWPTRWASTTASASHRMRREHAGCSPASVPAASVSASTWRQMWPCQAQAISTSMTIKHQKIGVYEPYIVEND